MKAIQVMFDETLLDRLDQDAEVKERGRSAVLRKAVARYLQEKQRREVAQAYRTGYGAEGLGKDWEGWEDEGEWPES